MNSMIITLTRFENELGKGARKKGKMEICVPTPVVLHSSKMFQAANLKFSRLNSKPGIFWAIKMNQIRI